MREGELNTKKFKPAIMYTIYIASTPGKVWQALTSAEFSTKYFFGNSVEVDLRVGGAYIVRTPDGALHISGEVIACDPLKRLTVTFNVNWPQLVEKLGPTLVTYEIEPAGDDQDIQVVYGPDGDQRVDRKEPAAWRAVSEAGHTRRRWVGERPDRDWDWLESPDDLLVEDQYAQEHPDGEDDEDQDEAV